MGEREREKEGKYFYYSSSSCWMNSPSRSQLVERRQQVSCSVVILSHCFALFFPKFLFSSSSSLLFLSRNFKWECVFVKLFDVFLLKRTVYFRNMVDVCFCCFPRPMGKEYLPSLDWKRFPKCCISTLFPRQVLLPYTIQSLRICNPSKGRCNGSSRRSARTNSLIWRQ